MNNKDSKNQDSISLKEIPIQLKVIFIIAFLSFLIIIGVYIWKIGFHITSDNDKWGQFGDYVGGILNPILAFLSLSAILYTILLQRDDLKRTNEELTIVKNRNKISDIVSVIKDISNEIDNTITRYIRDPHQIPRIENNTSHPNIKEVALKLGVMHGFLKDIEDMDKESYILKYYKIRYHATVRKLYGHGYLSIDINDFFDVFTM